MDIQQTIMEAVLAAIAGVMGWSWKRNEDTRDRVLEQGQKIEAIEDNVTHTRGRVDDIYDHLVAGRGLKAR